MRRLLQEPLLHFVVLGGVLFGAYALIGKKAGEEPQKIVVDAARIANLQQTFARTWQRPPSDEELRGLVDDYIKDEVFYREGRALGLDRDDIVIRRRLRQKMEFIAQDVAETEPTDAELAAYLAARPEKFRGEERFSFRHVYLNVTKRGDGLDGDIQALRAELRANGAEADETRLGDPFLLGHEFSALRRSEIARMFGERFAEQLAGERHDGWQGPIPSGYGLHFVLVSERMPGGALPLDAVREVVRREAMHMRRIESEEKLYRTLLQRYQVTIQPASGMTRTQAQGSPAR
jgi:hypothetical protein